MVDQPRRTIEKIPALMVALLEETKKLPTLPAAFAVDTALLGYRHPGLAEGVAQTWVALWEGAHLDGGGSFNPIAGLAAYVDRYDFHSASDVRETVYLAGSKRACVELMQYLIGEAREQKRRVLGHIDAHNTAMKNALHKMGLTQTRVTFEDRR